MTQSSPFLFTRRVVVAAAAGTCLSLACSFSAGAATEAEAQARYQSDMATCTSGKSNQDLETCRREATNALAEARRGGLSDPGAATQANATQRCLVLPAAERADCESRQRGEGNTQGSVGGGGIIRETVTVVPAK